MKNIKPVNIILTLARHPVLGMLILPYAAEDGPDETIQVTDPGNHLPPYIASRLNGAERRVIEIASSYAEKHLMKIFSRETILPLFYKKMTEADFKNVIRPFIEKKLVEMLKLIRTEKIPFYQNEKGNKILYAHNMIDVSPYHTDVMFDFEVDNRKFHYSLQCYRNGEPVSLLDKKPVIVLTSSPATLLLGTDLHIFKDISSMRLLPFTNKARVSVDISETNKYLEKVVLPVLRHHEINHSGLRIFKEERPCEPVLSVEESVYNTIVLKLSFHYGNETFYPGSASHPKSAKTRTDEDGNVSIHYFHRDRTKEEHLRKQLTDAHLVLVDDSHFMLRQNAPEKDLIEWITANRDMLTANFHLTNSTNEATYCLDDIRIEQEISEKRDWLELHIIVIIGEFRIPFISFRKNILAGEREYTLPDGRIVLLPKEWFNNYTDLLEYSQADKADGETFRIKRIFTGLVEQVINNDPREKTKYQTKTYREPPENLKAKLRQYQYEGFNWMVHLDKHYLGGCLADDMGLGKTLQTLSLLQYTHDDSKKPASLIVMPTSLRHNWRKEIARFTTLTVYEFTGTSEKTNVEQVFDCYNLILTSYGHMRNNIGLLSRYLFEYVVLDESQYIKNSESQTFKAVIQLQCNHKLLLTGTPVENSLKDLWSQFHFLQPDLLGPENTFQKLFINPIKQGNEQAEAKLQRLIAPFILRRNKEEVAPELPPLTEETIYCEQTEEQKDIYEKEKNSLRNMLLQLKTEKEKVPHFIVLEGINKLRQLACHPRMIDKTFQGDSGKIREIISLFDTLQSEGHKVLIFSSYVKHLELIAEAFEANNWSYALLTGSSTNREEEIKRFADTEKIQAFLISLKAGGVGLNLTQADYVFIVDPWWNPAAELQAISRAHRIGQNKQVFAYRFITEGSIEEKITQLQEEKKELFNTFVVESNPLISLSDNEWEKLLFN
ncbi:MAG: DEAD/DEAH box helicase [Mediterranea sp.]|jgi:SNF2 family DNA or RNA helicase|nr:DEAD/DEAH box helicase [Mediterranea sp.]